MGSYITKACDQGFVKDVKPYNINLGFNATIISFTILFIILILFILSQSSSFFISKQSYQIKNEEQQQQEKDKKNKEEEQENKEEEQENQEEDKNVEYWNLNIPKSYYIFLAFILALLIASSIGYFVDTYFGFCRKNSNTCIVAETSKLYTSAF